MPARFADLPLLPSLGESLARAGLDALTEVQALALPLLLDRRSVVAVAETGSGKTLTYVLPVLDRLKRMELDGNPVDTEREPRAIVLVPSRELGEQVAGVFKTLTHDTRLRVRAVVGGQRLRQSRDSVSGLVDVLIATPGRLQRLCALGEVSLDAVRVVVLDEVDQLLDAGFFPVVSEIVRACPSQRQLALFSATLSPALRELLARLCPEARVVETGGAGRVVPTLRTRRVDVPDGRRLPVLLRVLAEPSPGGTLLFVNTRDQVDAVAEGLRAAGLACGVLRGEMDPVERRRTLRAFRDGALPLLLVTDVVARGLDLPAVGRVVNVHLPREGENYLHRVGRTARAGREGLVVDLVTPRDAPLMATLGGTAPRRARPPGR